MAAIGRYLSGRAVDWRTAHPGLEGRIQTGLCQTVARDVMRGADTQIAGFLAVHPGNHGTPCFPGAYRKGGRLADALDLCFQIAMSGHPAAMLRCHKRRRRTDTGRAQDGVCAYDVVFA